jgi:hypothetical protein
MKPAYFYHPRQMFRSVRYRVVLLRRRFRYEDRGRMFRYEDRGGAQLNEAYVFLSSASNVPIRSAIE